MTTFDFNGVIVIETKLREWDITKSFGKIEQQMSDNRGVVKQLVTSSWWDISY